MFRKAFTATLGVIAALSVAAFLGLAIIVWILERL